MNDLHKKTKENGISLPSLSTKPFKTINLLGTNEVILTQSRKLGLLIGELAKQRKIKPSAGK